MMQKPLSFTCSHYITYITINYTAHTGNWSPSDFPEGDSFPPYKEAGHSVNRDMLVVMKSPDIVDKFNKVFSEDWLVGTPWQPKDGVRYTP